MCENEPAVSSGKSDCGRHCRRKLERPEITDMALPSSSVLQHHLGAVRQLAHDVVEQMRRNGGRAGLLDLGGGRLGHFEVEVGRLHFQARAVARQQHVGQDRDGVAPLDHAMHVVERLQEIGAFEDDTHDETELACNEGAAVPEPAMPRRAANRVRIEAN